MAKIRCVVLLFTCSKLLLMATYTIATMAEKTEDSKNDTDRKQLVELVDLK